MLRVFVRPFSSPLFLLGAVLLFLSGCFYSCPLTGFPSQPINGWLMGVWEMHDAQKNLYRARVVPRDETHYWIEIEHVSGPNSGPNSAHRPWKVCQFTATASRVEGMSFLNFIPQGSAPWNEEGKSIAIVHYQLQSPMELVVTPLQLPCLLRQSSFALRRQVRLLKKAGTLLPPSQSLFWVKVSEIYWEKKNASLNAGLASQPFQPLRIPPPRPGVPSMDSALQAGPGKSYRQNQ